MAARILGTRRANLLSYWQLNEASGTAIVDASGNGRNGVYGPITLGQPGIDGSAPAFDGSTSFANIYSASFAAAFNPNELTVLLWLKAPLSVWTDATQRRGIALQTSSSIRVSMYKTATTDQLTWIYQAGGISSVLPVAFLVNPRPPDWFCMGITVSKTADQMIAYYNGVSAGAPITGLGTWVGALNSTQCCIGAGTTGALNPWSGQAGHAAVWNVALTPGEMLTMGRP